MSCHYNVILLLSRCQVGEDAQRLMASLKASDKALGESVLAGEKLKAHLGEEKKRADSAEDAAAGLQREVSEANAQIQEQQDMLEKVRFVPPVPPYVVLPYCCVTVARCTAVLPYWLLPPAALLTLIARFSPSVHTMHDPLHLLACPCTPCTAAR